MSKAGAVWERLRHASPGLDHLSKAFLRYYNDSADRHAASISYYGFLCLFPLLLLVGSVVGFVVRGDAERQRRLLGHLGDYIPDSLADQLVDLVSERAGTTGLVGIAGLIVAGLGWVYVLRESIRSVWHQQQTTASIVRQKLVDVLVLLGLSATVLLSIGVSVVATALTREGMAAIGLPADEPLTALLLRLLALALALASDVALLVYVFVWLPHTAEPVRRVLRGALVGAICIEVAKYVGFYYFGLILDRGADLYGASLAVAFGLLLWINLLARLVMFAAAWTVTAPYREDVKPSGSSGEPPRSEGNPDAAEPAALRH